MFTMPIGENLDEAIRSLPPPSDYPMALPPTHLFDARWFQSMVDKGAVEPQMCTVFGENLVYCFYGGFFYRHGYGPTDDKLRLPVGFLFEPILLGAMDRYYPFDTGALASGKCGHWSTFLHPFKEKFRIAALDDFRTPSLIVHHLFGSNVNYLQGAVLPADGSLPRPLLELSEFLRADLTSLGIDQRQCRIECHSTKSLPLDKLIWVGFPEDFWETFGRLCRLLAPSVPPYYPYEAHRAMRPAEAATILQNRAHDEIKRYISLWRPQQT